jgi:hypothetical protein
VAQGPKGGGGSRPDDGKKQTAGKEEDDDADAKEYAERRARMRRLSDERRVSDEAESRLRAEREALDRLVAERDARQATIDRLRSAEEMAVRERLGMKRDESSRLAELEGAQEDAERARILSVERERMIRLDMQLARVETMALEERIETIRDQVRRLEGEQDRTRAMLEVRMKTATVTASTVTSSTPSSSSSPALRMADVKKAVATADAGKRSPSYTATTAGPVVKATMSSSPIVPSSSRSLLDFVSADGPSPLGTAYAAGALVLGAGAGAVLFLNKEDEDDDNKARGDEGPSSSPPSTMSSDRSSSSSSASLDDAAKYDERSGGGPSSSSSFGAYGGRGGDDGTAQTAPTSVSREDRYSRTIIDRGGEADGASRAQQRQEFGAKSSFGSMPSKGFGGPTTRSTSGASTGPGATGGPFGGGVGGGGTMKGASPFGIDSPGKTSMGASSSGLGYGGSGTMKGINDPGSSSGMPLRGMSGPTSLGKGSPSLLKTGGGGWGGAGSGFPTKNSLTDGGGQTGAFGAAAAGFGSDFQKQSFSSAPQGGTSSFSDNGIPLGKNSGSLTTTTTPGFGPGPGAMSGGTKTSLSLQVLAQVAKAFKVLACHRQDLGED